VNYGGIGAVIGHEMSHGFDDEGCQFDKDGNLRNWWTAEDKANYDKRTKVLADWFSQQEVQPGLKVDGKKTLGENIGDNGGINIAFRAFQNVHEAESRRYKGNGRLYARTAFLPLLRPHLGKQCRSAVRRLSGEQRYPFT
jgi:putative endopeptidase